MRITFCYIHSFNTNWEKIEKEYYVALILQFRQDFGNQCLKSALFNGRTHDPYWKVGISPIHIVKICHKYVLHIKKSNIEEMTNRYIKIQKAVWSTSIFKMILRKLCTRRSQKKWFQLIIQENYQRYNQYINTTALSKFLIKTILHIIDTLDYTF